MLDEIFNQFPFIENILIGLSTLMIVAQVIVFLTPSKKDDEWLEEFKSKSIVKKVWSFILGFAPIKIKDGKLLPSQEEK